MTRSPSDPAPPADLTITRVRPDDTAAVEAVAVVGNAARAVDSPWEHPLSATEVAGSFRYGYDGEPPTPYVMALDGVPVGYGALSTSDWDNRDLAWLEVVIHPDHRRRGLGSRLLAALEQEAATRGRISLGADGWDGPALHGFAAAHGYEPRAVEVQRRQVLAEVDWDLVASLRAKAASAAADYDVVRRTGATPDDEVDAVVELTAAINDAPTDDLDIEDEVFSPERLRAHEASMAARGFTVHRVLARHRGTGELAGHTVVVVERDRPGVGEQHDTSVARAHRGHRIGLLLKTEMLLWLREVEPQLATIDTWNAESNDHMISVNEQLGYRVLGRGINVQRSRR